VIFLVNDSKLNSLNQNFSLMIVFIGVQESFAVFRIKELAE